MSDHIRALFKHSCPGLFDLCLTNSSPIPPAVVQRYALEGAEPILCDREAVRGPGGGDRQPPGGHGGKRPGTPQSRPSGLGAGAAAQPAEYPPGLPGLPPHHLQPRRNVRGEPSMQSFAYKVKSELCRQPVSAAVLRPGGGLWGAAVLQHLHRRRGAHHHGESRVCRPAAPAVPAGLFPEIRQSAGAAPGTS